MELRIEREPCMLYETVELLYAFVNDIPAERLTAEGTYCQGAPSAAEGSSGGSCNVATVQRAE